MTEMLVNGQVLTPRGFEAATVVLDGERIAEVRPAVAGDHGADLEGGWLVPGFIDTQVNGGGGALFNDDPTTDAIAAIGAAHRRFGTTGFLPTLISDDLATVARAIAAVDEAIAKGVPGVLGIHIEGPFLSASRKGIHDASKFRVLDDEAFDLLTSLRRGRTLVTLAPEATTPTMIRRLVEAGIVVAAGHTDADYDTIRAALDAGLSGFTHLFNAMSPMTSREPGAVGAALEDEASWCGLIVDGRHVHPAVLRVALRARRRDRFMLVTDALSSVGMAEKSFTVQGRRIHVVDGVCVDENGTIAGSDLDMASAVRNLVQIADLPLAEAAPLASANPAAFLRVADSLGAVAPGHRADLALLDASLHVRRTWIAGAAE